MGFSVYNTLTRSLEQFVPRDPAGKSARMYCCGPTVHNFAHIGNFRTFVFADLLRRYLEFRGYDVQHVMNITDVEDKIIAGARESGARLQEYTARYETAFFEDFKTLGCLPPHQTPRATDFIPEIIELITRLLERGFAYVASDGSVYFSIEKYRNSGAQYGRLVHLDFDHLRPGERVSADEYDKESIADFALWKARVPEDGNVHWSSPWGEGRPGWHIECSAMSMKLLGPSFDLHLGGEDLIFPHHEDEIAQSEGAGLQNPGDPFVKYWVHVAHLLVEGKKMSKSLGNFFTLRDLLNRGYSGREIRYLLLTANYRAPFNFTLENLHGARTSLSRIDECIAKLRELFRGAPQESDTEFLQAFASSLDDDLNVSAAWGRVFEWIRETNRLLDSGQMQPLEASRRLGAWDRVEAIFGIRVSHEIDVPAEMSALLDQRQAARQAKDFKKADAIREQLKSAGWQIEDTPKGPRLKRG